MSFAKCYLSFSRFICFVFASFVGSSAIAQTTGGVTEHDVEGRFIRNIYIDRADVFDERTSDWFFAANLANAFHTKTKEFIIEDELLIAEGDEVDSISLLEIERNLRRTGLFSTVRVNAAVVGQDSVDIYVYTQDRWSLRPAILFGTGGGISSLGAKLEEVNLAGVATQVMFYGLYRTENDIGWEGMLQASQRRIFRSELNAGFAIKANRFRTDQSIYLTKPYRTMLTPWAFGVSALNAYGSDFTYVADTTNLLPFHERSGGGWISQASGDEDRLFVSGAIRFSDVERTNPASRQAFDNTGHVLISFASLRMEFDKTQFLNGFETEDVMKGAWGSATIGRIFSLGNGGETMWYVSGTAEQSGKISSHTYLFGGVTGATGFGDNRPKYTYLELTGIGRQHLSNDFLLVAKVRSQTAWNWNAYRQLVADFESGVRGYRANSLLGDNRLVANAELRWFPKLQAWIFGMSAVAFYDVASVWNQGTSAFNTRFHHATGLGLRLHNLKAAGADAVYSFDVAYNFDEGRVTGLQFKTSQYFSAFQNHIYRAPDVSGAEIDTQ